MKNISKNMLYLLIIILIIVIFILVGIIGNRNNTIDKQEESKEQLTTTTSSNAYVTTEAHLSEISEKEQKLCRIIYLGRGTSFDVKNIEGVTYTDLTASNFIVQSTASGSARGGSKHVDNYDCGPMAKCSLTKTYDASTGTLKAYQNFNGGYYTNNSSSYSGSASGKAKVDAYLVIGTIENL